MKREHAERLKAEIVDGVRRKIVNNTEPKSYNYS